MTFKFLSLKTLLHCTWYLAPTVTIVLLHNTQIMQDAQKINLEVWAARNLIDRLSQFATFAFSALFTLFPFLIASGLPKISELALASDLRFPKYGKRTLLAILCHLGTQICGKWLNNQSSSQLKMQVPMVSTRQCLPVCKKSIRWWRSFW